MLSVKPIKLKISAFGPYAEEMPEINFTDFEEQGLFLIAGDTGAGKTTIFDAICFALYGETSGSYRDTKNLRSEYAKTGTQSYVDFYFTHHKKAYHVYRMPACMRPKKRGKGMMFQDEKACFYKEGELPIEGKKDVDRAVRDLLHVDVGQFKQIVMIAQGEFRELLNADTGKRTDILRTIFMTDGYREIAEGLKKRKDVHGAECEAVQKSIIQYFNGVCASEESAYGEKLSELKEHVKKSQSIWNMEEIIAVLEQIQKEDEGCIKELSIKVKEIAGILEKEKEKRSQAQSNNLFIERYRLLKEERKNLEEKKEEMASLGKLIQRQQAATLAVQPVYELAVLRRHEMETAKERVTQTQKEWEGAKEKHRLAVKQLKESEGKKEEAEKLRKEAEFLQGEIAKYEERDRLLIKIEELKKEKTSLGKEEEEIKKEEAVIKDKIESLQRAIEIRKDKPAVLERILMEQEQIAELESKFVQLQQEEIPDYEREQREYTKQQDNFVERQKEWEAEDVKRQQAEIALDNCRAGLLAAGLQEGMSCPVCGSTHHPLLAGLPEDVMTEEELKAIQAQAEERRRKKEESLRQVERNREGLKAREKSLQKSIQEILAHKYLKNHTACDGAKQCSMDQNPQSLLARIDMLQEILDSLQQDMKKRLADTQKECEILNKDTKTLKIAYDIESKGLEEKKNQFAKRLEEQQKAWVETQTLLAQFTGLASVSKEEAQEKQQKAWAESKRLFDAIEKVEQKEKDAGIMQEKCASALETLQKTYEESVEKRRQQQEEFEKLLRKNAFASEEEFQRYVVAKEDIRQGEEAKNEYEHQVKSNAAACKQAEQDAQGRVWIEVEPLDEMIAGHSEELESLRGRKAQEENRMKNNQSYCEDMKKQGAELTHSMEQYNRSMRLYKLVNGQLANKLTLEQYVQGMGFDSIIAAANRRLMPMTDFRYELQRKTQGDDKRSNTSFDLEVLDHFTGHKRPVRNLSGGESFQASLSLALGLSDTISANRGGVQMDALFIDEGFGSLDRTFMERAMDTLMQLSEAHKLVGIISHREELKENIPQQIQIEKTREGSLIKVLD